MDKDLLGIIIVIITFFVLVLFGTIQFDKIECKAKAKAIGYISEYGILQGCVLEKPNGKKILLKQLRDFDN